MPRPLLHYEAPWSWRSLRPIPRSGHHRVRQLPPRQRTHSPITPKSPIGLARKFSSLAPPPVRNQEQPSLQKVARTSGSNPPGQDKRASNRGSLRKRLLAALNSNNPDLLLALAIEAFRNDELVQSLRPTTIAQIFDSLRFNELLAEHKRLANTLAPGVIRAAQAGGWKIYNIRKVIERIHDRFSTLFDEWVDNGHPIDLPKCKSFLRFLSCAGQADGARKLRALCENHGIQWDTEAYNLFLEALCWEDAYVPDGFGKLRVTDAALKERKLQETMSSSQGHTTAIKSEAIDTFEEMMSKGFTADVQTFSLLMLSMGRVGDLEGVEATLNRIWGVDVPSLIDGDGSSVYFENDMQPDTPLYPNQHLLFAVAHIYGSNNSLPKALKVVDFIAQKYSIDIDSRTWEELMKWAFVLGSRRGGNVTLSEHKVSLQRSLSAGKVPQATVRSLWRTMMNSRPQSTPALHVYDWMYSSLYRRGELIDMVRLLREAQRRLGLGRSHAKLQIGGGPPINTVSHRPLAELEQLQTLANSTVFLRWVRLMLHTNFFATRTLNLSLRWLHTAFVPNCIGEWGNLWFNNTFQTFHCRTMHGTRLSFHRQMQEENKTQMEVFSSPSRGRYIVRAKSSCLTVPFQEISHGERRQARLERELEKGLLRRYDPPLQWYERSKVGDWIWLSSGKGIRLDGGRFEGSRFEGSQYGRKLVLPSHALDHLERDEAIEVRQRIEAQ